MVAVCWHFAYGVWLFAAKWGITPGEKSRRRFAWICLGGGIALCAMGLASIWAFVGPKYQNTPADIAPPANVSSVHDALSPFDPHSLSLSAPHGASHA